MNNSNDSMNFPQSPRFKILLQNGQESPLLTQTEIYEYARSGFIKPESLVYDEVARVWAAAHTIPPLLAVLKQTGRIYTPPPMPEPPRPQSYQQGHQQFAAPPTYGVVQYSPGHHNPTAAIVCAVLLTGVGQMLNHQVIKGVVLLLSAIVLGVATGGVAALIIWIVALVDAVAIGNRLHRGEAVREWQFF